MKQYLHTLAFLRIVDTMTTTRPTERPEELGRRKTFPYGGLPGNHQASVPSVCLAVFSAGCSSCRSVPAQPNTLGFTWFAVAHWQRHCTGRKDTCRVTFFLCGWVGENVGVEVVVTSTTWTTTRRLWRISIFWRWMLLGQSLSWLKTNSYRFALKKLKIKLFVLIHAQQMAGYVFCQLKTVWSVCVC